MVYLKRGEQEGVVWPPYLHVPFHLSSLVKVQEYTLVMCVLAPQAALCAKQWSHSQTLTVSDDNWVHESLGMRTVYNSVTVYTANTTLRNQLSCYLSVFVGDEGKMRSLQQISSGGQVTTTTTKKTVVSKHRLKLLSS